MNPNWQALDEHPLLGTDEAHIWAVSLDATALQLHSTAAILSHDERQRASQFSLDAPRHRFVATRAALRILLGRYLDLAPADVSIFADANGKPLLAGQHSASRLSFNIAHSGALALVAVTLGREIGVDLERLRSIHHAQHIARRYFHPAEIAAIATAPPSVRDAVFLRCWTGKEAVLKAIGTGIKGSLAAFQVPDIADPQRDMSIDVPTLSQSQLTPCWLRRLDPDDDYLAAVAVVGTQIAVRCMAFAW